MCTSLCFFDAIVELHDVDEKICHDSLIENENGFHIKSHLNHDLHLVHVVEAQSKYMNPFSRMFLVHIHLFFSIKFSYIGGLLS
jgi:hypothetical protein